MLEEMVARQPPSAGEPAGSDRLPVSLNRLFLGGLLPSRAPNLSCPDLVCGCSVEVRFAHDLYGAFPVKGLWPRGE